MGKMIHQRPAVAIGHIPLHSPDVEKTARFLDEVGMRAIFQRPGMGIFELRGGTHLVLRQGAPESDEVAFDLMVDDLDATRAQLQSLGYEATAIERGGGPHSRFFVVDGAGLRYRFNSSHVGALPV